MLSLQSCPQCHHVYSVPVHMTTSDQPEVFVAKFQDNKCKRQISNNINNLQTTNMNTESSDHCCNNKLQNNNDMINSNTAMDTNTTEDWNTNECPVRYRQKPQISTQNHISNRMSLSGGGLISINVNTEPIEPITPSSGNYNPFTFQCGSVNGDSDCSPTSSFENEEFEEESNFSNESKKLNDEIIPEFLRKPHSITPPGDCSPFTSQVSPTMPLSFIMPISRPHSINGCERNRPVSHVLLSQKTEITPLSLDLYSVPIINGFLFPHNNGNMRPLSWRIESRNSDTCQQTTLVPTSRMNQTFVTNEMILLPLQQLPELENDMYNLPKRLQCSNWYYESLTWQKSIELLKRASTGTFLVRDSSDPNHLYALSVQTKNGPTSIRLSYVDGYFSLDSEINLFDKMPKFSCIIKLVEYYIDATLLQETKEKNMKESLGNGKKVWMDSTGAIHSDIILKKPLYKNVPSLKHLTRLKIHKAIKSNGQPKLLMLPGWNQLDLPKSLADYLGEYPYTH